MGGSVEAALFLAGKVAAGLGIAAAAWLTGCLLLPRRENDRGVGRVALCGALGLAVLAQAFLLLGLLGSLTRPAVGALLVVLAAAAAILRRSDLRKDIADLRRELSAASVSAWIVAGIVVLLLAAAALYPPTAFDETLYHLPYAKAFAESGSLPWLPDLRFPTFPQASEALAAACLLLADDVATHLLALFATLLSAAFAASWASRQAGPRAGALAAALLLGEPVVAYHAGLTYVDPFLMLFATASLYSLGLAAESGETRWVRVAGVLAATAASVKYHGLYFVAAGAALVLFGPRPRMRRLILFGAAALAAALPTYGRLIAETGNPVFPFFASVFGENAWSDWGRLLRADDAGRGPASTAGEYLVRAARYPIDLLLRRGPFWHPPVSPLLMAGALAGAMFAVRRRGAGRVFLAVAGGYLCVVLFLSPDPRYLLPIAPGFAALGAAAIVTTLSRWSSPRRARLVALLALAALAPGMAYVGRLEIRRGLPAMTAAARERYLEARLPHYGAVRSLNERYGSDYSLYAFGAENMAYFARGRFRGDHYGPWAYLRVLAEARRNGSLRDVLREMGVTHLLVPAGSREAITASSERLHVERSDASTVVFGVASDAGPSSSR